MFKKTCKRLFALVSSTNMLGLSSLNVCRTCKVKQSPFPICKFISVQFFLIMKRRPIFILTNSYVYNRSFIFSLCIAHLTLFILLWLCQHNTGHFAAHRAVLIQFSNTHTHIHIGNDTTIKRLSNPIDHPADFKIEARKNKSETNEDVKETSTLNFL